ncbi:MAG: glycosyltransferase family 2 protein [Cyanobacteria bacterium J06648_16]
MKIHSLCIAKDEADIIEQTLRAAAVWSDSIYFYDNGSQDGTWEKVLALSEALPKIVPYRQDDRPFHNGLRGEIFNHYRQYSQPSDWWCRLDADEIYIDDPRIFLAKVPPRYTTIWSSSFQYYLSDADIVRFEQNPNAYADDVPVEQKCRYYINNWSETRFFRDRSGLVWLPDERWPAAVVAARPYPIRIRLKHYQYRSPQQIQRRLDIRRAARARGSASFAHEVQTNWHASTLQVTQPNQLSEFTSVSTTAWRDRVLPAAELNYDTHDGRYIAREDLLPSLNPVGERLRAQAKRAMRAIKGCWPLGQAASKLEIRASQ